MTKTLRNHALYDLQLWYTCKKDSIYRCFLNIFQILIFGVNSGVKVKNDQKWQKNYVCHTPYLSKWTSYDCFFWCTSVKWRHLQMLFSYFQNFHFLDCQGGVGEGVKGQEMAQNYKKFCFTPYRRNRASMIMFFWYAVVKWWCHQQFFFSFSKFWLFRFFKVHQ